MKRKFWITSLMSLALVTSSLAFADHDEFPGYPGGNGDTDRLSREAQELDSVVHYSNLNYFVKGAVSNFATQVNAYATCTQNLGNGGYFRVEDHDTDWGRPDDGRFNGRCRFQLDQVLNTWNQVDRELHDTSYDFPQVYRQYLDTKSAVDCVRNGNGGGGYQPPYNPGPRPPYPPGPMPRPPYPPGPGPGPRPPYPPYPPTPNPGPRRVEASGYMDNLSFNFSAYSTYDLQNQCVNYGRSRGITYVRGINVNGRVIGGMGYMTLEQACAQVAANAREC